MFTVEQLDLVGSMFPSQEDFARVLDEAKSACAADFAGKDSHQARMEMHGACMYLEMYADLMWGWPEKVASVVFSGPASPRSMGPLTLPELFFEAAWAHFAADMDLAYGDFTERMGWEG